MRILFTIWCLCLASLGVVSAGETEIVDVSPKEVMALLQSKSPPQVIDVRTEAEFKDGHLKGAQVIDVRGSKFEEKLAKLDTKQAYVVHCRSGGRSGRSLSIFKKLGFTKIYHMNEGMLAWQKAKMPTVKE